MSRNEQIVADVEGGMSYAQAARKHGVTRNVVAGAVANAKRRAFRRPDISEMWARNPEKLARVVREMNAGRAKRSAA